MIMVTILMSMHKEALCTDARENNKGHDRNNIRREQKKCNRSARNRLLSISYDVDNYCRPIIEQISYVSDIPIIANERCGTWYATPLMKNNPISCCFKSTDGHYGIWNFSLKRLNLNVVRIVSSHQACTILDASMTKIMPDSFSRTIPIWAAVITRIAIRYRKFYNITPCEYDEMDENSFLVTPDGVVTEAEHVKIQNVINERVEILYQSQAIVNPVWLAETLQKPLRPIWITPHSALTTVLLDSIMSPSYYSIICINCSDIKQSKSLMMTSINQSDETFIYLPGAADDQESWARHLSPTLFWKNIHTIFNSNPSSIDSVHEALDLIVRKEKKNNEAFEQCIVASELEENPFSQLEFLNLSIGTRRAGRPPSCWNHFDAVLNVSDEEYSNIYESVNIDNEKDNIARSRFYLQLPVREGKRDRTELEHWMTIGILFVVVHARANRRILIHCAQGLDRSVAIAVAVVSIFCDCTYPIKWNDFYNHFPVQDFIHDNLDEFQNNISGLSTDVLKSMVGREGRDRLFELIYRNDSSNSYSKESIRIALHLVKQYREKANPSRSTMQKLHRFFITCKY